MLFQIQPGSTPSYPAWNLAALWIQPYGCAARRCVLQQEQTEPCEVGNTVGNTTRFQNHQAKHINPAHGFKALRAPLAGLIPFYLWPACPISLSCCANIRRVFDPSLTST